ncbi:MAG: AraC family transcriptional regulator [Proteobacteria bacterium]|nr:AraC family transcriptional regulator [Pseudomonadota bacterium]
MPAAALRLFDPRRGDVAFQLEPIRSDAQFARPQRFNYFTVLCVQAGQGTVHADHTEHRFYGPALLFFNPYQTFAVTAETPLRGVRLQFHANFFCIETHHEAVGCNGVLFNDLYGQPWLRLSAAAAVEFGDLVAQMEREFRGSGLAHGEVLVSLLKLFLIKATRLKVEQQQLAAQAPATARPPVLEALTQLLEQHFRTKHAPAEYATALHMTPKALGKLVKLHFGRTLTELIRERWLKHAKWQLLHTQRSVKEIAWEVGFEDELYFSRLFKRATGCSPTGFREFETEIRQGSNLSM